MRHNDPVCGMQVEEWSAAGKSNYEEEIYYFCSETCKEKFDKRPEQYAYQIQQPRSRSASQL